MRSLTKSCNIICQKTTPRGGAGTATNTLAVYNADPVTGGTADPTKWEIYSTIVDGKMPDTPDGTCEDLKFWNKTDWKSASKFLEAIDGSTSDTLQNIDNGEYAMIARDSYRNVAVPAYKKSVVVNPHNPKPAYTVNGLGSPLNGFKYPDSTIGA